MPAIVKATPHIAFAVDNLDEALEGKEVLIAPNALSPGVRVAFIVHDGAPVELLEFIDPAPPKVVENNAAEQAPQPTAGDPDAARPRLSRDR
ncbi:MAG: hypothetical protein NT151_08915 [Acidobacteria bacterium]|nr:hypothetical protein [Acidobacteriota bacterium]